MGGVTTVPTSAPRICRIGCMKYDCYRPHASLNYQTPISTLGFSVNNLVDLHT